MNLIFYQIYLSTCIHIGSYNTYNTTAESLKLTDSFKTYQNYVLKVRSFARKIVEYSGLLQSLVCGFLRSLDPWVLWV